jgi:hypothetical protein
MMRNIAIRLLTGIIVLGILLSALVAWLQAA